MLRFMFVDWSGQNTAIINYQIFIESYKMTPVFGIFIDGKNTVKYYGQMRVG